MDERTTCNYLLKRENGEQASNLPHCEESAAYGNCIADVQLLPADGKNAWIYYHVRDA